ncbi:FecCD family ABC transporter permease [Gynuella sunshinyii]|uniref:ABC-type Fe3+-siderophore transport system, permease component n=1 Tax=Gynuella sunshinyii YC6258 TaxID=1445510 RepID=A0A0C5VMM9_9GAMM|nr:iron ABC transporter permease [Gynuella sunshinyii]AJQ95571.1 ABC-type Fe3+-siderophore transport system, permease component [Gynuella sunshinyii YC6258]
MTELLQDRPQSRRLYGLLLILLVFCLSCWLHLTLGAENIPTATVWQALTNYQHDIDSHSIVHDLRLNRLWVAMLAGACLAVSGVLIQAISRNPLADPGLLGINSGAAFFVVTGLLFISAERQYSVPLLAFAGALFASVLVLSLSGKQQNPSRMVLAGAAVAAMFTAMTTVLLLIDQQGLEKLRHWLTGGVGAADIHKVAWVAPYLFIAFPVSLLMSKSLNAHHLGDTAAAGVGVKVGRLKLMTLVLVTLLSGCSVAVVGPVGFIGLVVPHIARFFVRNDYRWLIPYSLLLGATLMVAADLIARILVRPYEINTGIVTALIGAPVFISLVIWRVR